MKLPRDNATEAARVVERIKRIRRHNKVRQDRLAKAIGVTECQYSRIERGLSHLRVTDIIRIAKFFGVPAATFLDL